MEKIPERQAESLVRVAQEGFNLRDQLYTHQPYLSFLPAGEDWSLLSLYVSARAAVRKEGTCRANPWKGEEDQ